MSQPEFTIEDILRELGADAAAQGITSEEIIRASGRSEAWVHTRIAMAIQAGTMEYAGRRPGMTVDQRKCMKPVYRLKRKEGEHDIR